MSRLTLLSLSAIALVMPAMAFADPAPTRSAAQIVCELTGDCAGVAGGNQAKRPAEAAFSFTRPNQDKAVHAAAVKPGKAAKMTAARPAPRASGGIDMRITFANGSADMTPQGRAEAAQFAKAMAMPQLAGRRFAVEGHTNSIGTPENNRALSERRAAAVSSYLVSLGVDQSRIETHGYGFDRPLPGRPTVSAANRRVQFVPLG